jgi:hypothetical protein
MYDVFLFAHSWFRWMVLIAGLRLFYVALKGWIQNKSWDSSDSEALSLFNEVLLFQIVMGICLYGFLSPLPKIGWSDMEFARRDPILRFWTIEHPVGMIIALSVFQIGRMLAIKKFKIQQRFKVITITLTLSLVIILATIPWPFLKHGRDLFRLYF